VIEKHVLRYMLCVYGKYVNFCEKVALMSVLIMDLGESLGCLADSALFGL